MNPPVDQDQGDWARLEADIAARVAGPVRFDAGARALYGADASNYRQIPTGVVVPHSVEDVVADRFGSRRHRANVAGRSLSTSTPLLERTGGTS